MATQGQHHRATHGADEQIPDVWGLWNDHLQDWFNPGAQKPYFLTRRAAERMIPRAQRQYPRGVWTVQPYPQDVALSGSITDSPGGTGSARGDISANETRVVSPNSGGT